MTEQALRQRVDELEATIQGLTQELAEAKERIRQLEEDENDVERPADRPMPVGEEGGNEDGADEEAEEAEVEDDIIVA